MLQIKQLSVGVDQKTILKNISFNFEKNKTYAIMGPNGSGKSTLAFSIMGHPDYKVHQGSRIEFEKENLIPLGSADRAKKGIFLSFQSPLALSGVNIFQLLRYTILGKKDPLELRKKVQQLATELKIKDELLTRSLNEGASGGEKKKLEVLQAAILGEKLLIFDEIDTGVDIDSLKLIASFLQKNQKGKTYLIITHYNRIFHYLKPDRVLVLINGQLQKVGDYTLTSEIEKNGYAKYK